ncbi:Protein of unknown function [Propionibacterium cyclohexanicum]|uniref:Uncharacterized protein n=1 Tax=Propionibacterium cyclohexanicum TaxID=64702 RepID=A0A1H9PYL1_9ACTN|nr:Protein of unknown function [Propionibacterium cyclohexanicum]
MFQDSAIQPDGRIIRAALSADPEVWDLLTAVLTDSGVTVSWRYYRDGGWLAKATLKTKTIAWLAVGKGSVRVTFHFSERHPDRLCALPELPAEVRRWIAETALSGKLLPVTFEVRDRTDIAPVQARWWITSWRRGDGYVRCAHTANVGDDGSYSAPAMSP